MSATQQVPRPDLTVDLGGGRTPRKPSRAWYAVAAAIAVIGLVVGLAWGLTTYFDYRDEIQGFARMRAPGASELALDGGPQTIYFEGSSASTPTATDVHVTSASGSLVPTEAYVGDVRYDAPDGSVGKAIATIVVPAPGTYRVVVDGPAGSVAFGRAVTSSMIVSVMGSIFLVFASLIAGIVIVVAVAIMRSSARKQSRQVQYR
jgi:hypothetical protein